MHATWTRNVHKPSYLAALEAPFLRISNWPCFNHGADIVTFGGGGSWYCGPATATVPRGQGTTTSMSKYSGRAVQVEAARSALETAPL